MWHILYFEILQKTKSLFLVLPLRGFFFVFQLGLFEFGFYIPVLHFCLAKSVVVTLINLRLNMSSLERLCKIIPLNISMIYESKKRWVQHPSGGFFSFCKINVYGLECFRCMPWALEYNLSSIDTIWLSF